MNVFGFVFRSVTTIIGSPVRVARGIRGLRIPSPNADLNLAPLSHRQPPTTSTDHHLDRNTVTTSTLLPRITAIASAGTHSPFRPSSTAAFLQTGVLEVEVKDEVWAWVKMVAHDWFKGSTKTVLLNIWERGACNDLQNIEHIINRPRGECVQQLMLQLAEGEDMEKCGLTAEPSLVKVKMNVPEHLRGWVVRCVTELEMEDVGELFDGLCRWVIQYGGGVMVFASSVQKKPVRKSMRRPRAWTSE